MSLFLLFSTSEKSGISFICNSEAVSLSKGLTKFSFKISSFTLVVVLYLWDWGRYSEWYFLWDKLDSVIWLKALKNCLSLELLMVFSSIELNLCLFLLVFFGKFGNGTSRCWKFDCISVRPARNWLKSEVCFVSSSNISSFCMLFPKLLW